MAATVLRRNLTGLPQALKRLRLPSIRATAPGVAAGMAKGLEMDAGQH